MKRLALLFFFLVSVYLLKGQSCGSGVRLMTEFAHGFTSAGSSNLSTSLWIMPRGTWQGHEIGLSYQPLLSGKVNLPGIAGIDQVVGAKYQYNQFVVCPGYPVNPYVSVGSHLNYLHTATEAQHVLLSVNPGLGMLIRASSRIKFDVHWDFPLAGFSYGRNAASGEYPIHVMQYNAGMGFGELKMGLAIRV